MAHGQFHFHHSEDLLAMQCIPAQVAAAQICEFSQEFERFTGRKASCKRMAAHAAAAALVQHAEAVAAPWAAGRAMAAQASAATTFEEGGQTFPVVRTYWDGSGCRALAAGTRTKKIAFVNVKACFLRCRHCLSCPAKFEL